MLLNDWLAAVTHSVQTHRRLRRAERSARTRRRKLQFDSARVAVVDISEDHARTVATELEDKGIEAMPVVADVTQERQVKDMVRAVLEGAVRARALLLAQSEQAREAIERTIVDGMGQFRSEGGDYDVPMPALVGAGEV